MELAPPIVELADKFVEEPWQNVFVPENVTSGVSKTSIIKDVVVLVPKAFVAEQYNVNVPFAGGNKIVVTPLESLVISAPVAGKIDQL